MNSAPLAAPHQQRLAIGEKVRAFFTEGALPEKIVQADELRQMPGIDSFRTPLPWKVTLPDGAPVIGDSEDLRTGISDIHALLVSRQAEFPTNAVIKPEIDNSRVKLMAAQSPAIFKQGGDRGK